MNSFSHWLRNKIDDKIDPLLRNQFIIQEQARLIDEKLDSFSTILGSIDRRISELHESRNQAQHQEPQAPLQSSRGSWPRMKRHFEESDVRKILESQKSTPQISLDKNLLAEAQHHAAELEAYWKSKGESDGR